MEFENIALDLTQVTCPRCSKYIITGSAIAILKGNKLSNRRKANISGFLKENSGYKIHINNLDTLYNIKMPSFEERADKILLNLEKLTEYAGEHILMDSSWISWGWCLDIEELKEFTDFLQNGVHRISSIDRHGRENGYKITPVGWQYLETIKKINEDSQQGFVAMMFNDDANLRSKIVPILYPCLLNSA
ncbi:MAG: hypothetical protein A2X59_03510 [Nitrospirae bacterium GWC2_42_7]|nr:MAG: hypothetical protein A2X59_03510 [Nitrospirae bacterium GWC2_42_7]